MIRAQDEIRLIALGEGYLQSNVLFALLDLGVFDALGAAERSASELADELGAREDRILRLLDSGVALRLLREDGGRYGVGPAAGPLAEGGGSAVARWLRFLALHQPAILRLPEAVRGGEPWRDLETAWEDADEVLANVMAMDAYAESRGRELVDHLDLSGSRDLLDVGCGPGTYAFHLATRWPELRLHLVDAPLVLDVARQVERRFDLAGRVVYHPLDVTRDEIPGVYDVVLISNTLHLLGERRGRDVLDRLRNRVRPGGSIVVQAQFLDDDRQGGRWPTLLDLMLLCSSAEGRNHTFAETEAWLREAGFRRPERCRMSLANVNGFVRAWREGPE